MLKEKKKIRRFSEREKNQSTFSLMKIFHLHDSFFLSCEVFENFVVVVMF